MTSLKTIRQAVIYDRPPLIRWRTVANTLSMGWRCARLFRMLGGEVEEGPQYVVVLDQALYTLGILPLVLLGKDRESGRGVDRRVI